MSASPSNILRYSRVFLLGLLGLAFSQPAFAWWNSEWTLRKTISIDPAGIGAESPGGVAVLVRLHEGDFNFNAAKPDGTDLRFVASDDKTLLPYHIEKLDTILNEAFVWVRVPNLKAAEKTNIWLYYGNAGNKATKAEDSKATYDADTLLVYHFGEHGQPPYDFTANGNNAQGSAAPVEGALIGTGVRLDGHSAITIPSNPSFTWADRTPLTWSIWAKVTTPQPHSIIFSRTGGGRGFVVGIDDSIPYIEITDAVGKVRSQPGTALPANTWKHVAVIASGSRITLYIDGDSYASVTGAIPALDGDSLIGSQFVGELDELVVSKIARPASFVKFEAVSQGGEQGSKVVAVGPDEQQSSLFSALKTGYVGVIIGSLTVDGWVVIGILAVMSGISWWVMIRKGGALNKVSKGNEMFLKEWGQVATDLSVLDEPENARTLGGRLDGRTHRAIRDSSIYKIYHVGIEEIRHRHGNEASPGGRVLSARSIHAIRAALDGTLVRETQRLNSGMVLLTIAISGGPFLGLLGTVVGVMITFAAVAQAGDVNVNAIAPGIAAALAATVAGLAVAIPALFGYNYLLTRVKIATTDMHVFIDEFVTKLAEFYSETVISD